MKIEQLFAQDRKESSKIEFPQDIRIVKALQAKLAEYQERLQKKIKENPHKPPEAFADTKYKIAILQELLLTGKVEGEELFKKITNESGEAFDLEAFGKAYEVIEDYAKTGGKSTVGGTGLKVENVDKNDFERAKQPEVADLKDKIKSAGDFNELYPILKNIKGIQGSSEFYNSPDLIQKIEGVRNISKKLGSETGINMITHSEGLRDKVSELIRKEIM